LSDPDGRIVLVDQQGVKVFYAFVEFDGDFGRRRLSRGFTTAAARERWLSNQGPMTGEEWSDEELWEAPQEEWAHIPILA